MSELTITREFGTTEYSIATNMFSFGSYTRLKVMVSYDESSQETGWCSDKPFQFSKEL